MMEMDIEMGMAPDVALEGGKGRGDRFEGMNGAATDAIQAAIAGGVRAAALPDGLLLKAWVSLTLWTLAPLAGALAWFRRQDLSKE